MNSPFPGYSQPHDTLTQNLDNVVTPVINRMNPVLMGTQYLLSLNDGRALGGDAYSTGSTTLLFKYVASGTPATLNLNSYTVDLGSVQLIADQLEAVVSSGALNLVNASGSTNPYQLKLASTLFYSSASNALDTNLRSRPVQPGDWLLVHAGANNSYCRVTGYIAKPLTPTISAVTSQHANLSTITTPGVTVNSTFLGSIDNTFITTVVSNTAGTVTATVHDTAGLYPLRTVTWTSTSTTDKVYLEGGNVSGLALTMNVNASGVSAQVAGDMYTVAVTTVGSSAVDYSGLLVDSQAYPSGYTGTLTADVVVKVSGQLTAALNASDSATLATITAASVVYNGSNLGVWVNSVFCPFTTAKGYLKLAYRAAKLTSATSPPLLVGPNDDLSQFGEYNVQNDLAYGIRAMRSGAGDTPIYVLAIDGDTTDAVTAGLKKLRSSDLFYAIALLTARADTTQLLRDDILASSGPATMKWRKGYVGYDSPGQYVLWGLTTSGTYRKATLSSGLLTIDTGDRQYGDLITANVRSGDLIKFSNLSTYYTVDTVVGGVDGQSWQLRILESAANITTSQAFTIVKPDSADNTADYITELASEVGGTLGDGRITLLWGDAIQTGLNGSGVLPNKYLSAYLAGLRTALFPQQGTATYEVPIALSAPTMHTKFSPQLLQAMAAQGVMVVTQDTADTPVYILDQVTTCTSGGLLKFQDNLHVIADSFSYAIKDSQVGLKGRKNATKVTAAAIQKATTSAAISYCQVPLSEHQVAGPRVMAFYDKNGTPNQVTVERSADFVNRIATYTQIDVPVPLNGIDNVLRVSIGTTF